MKWDIMRTGMLHRMVYSTMKSSSSMVNWFTSGGLRYALEPETGENWYVLGQYDNFWYPIRSDIKDWLEKYMPERYWVADVGISGPETTTHRAIYFELESDLILFKINWTGKTSIPWATHTHY